MKSSFPAAERSLTLSGLLRRIRAAVKVFISKKEDFLKVSRFYQTERIFGSTKSIFLDNSSIRLFIRCAELSRLRETHQTYRADVLKQRISVQVHLYFVRGDLAPSNWSFFELKWEGRLRIILDSLNGDADLYLSYTKASGVVLRCFLST